MPMQLLASSRDRNQMFELSGARSRFVSDKERRGCWFGLSLGAGG